MAQIKSQIIYRGSCDAEVAMLFMLFEDNRLFGVRGKLAEDGKTFIMSPDTAEEIILSEADLNDLYCGVLDAWDYRMLKQLYKTRHFVPLFEEDAETVAQN